MATQQFKIESGVPIPTGPVLRKSKYPLAGMQPGDSFFVPGAKVSIQKSVRAAASVFSARNKGTEFTARLVEGGLRVWRVK
jgi:hypothetical protein